MRARFASRSRSSVVRLAGASVLTGALPSLFPVTAVLTVTPAAAANAPAPAHPYAAHVTEAALRFGIPEAWIWAVMRVESNGDPAAISHAGAIGLMQITPGTWAILTARYGLGGNPWDVRANINAGAAYLREMVDRYGDLPAAFAAYNAGPGRVDDWRLRGRPLPAETIAYVAKVEPILGISGIASPAAPRAPATPSWCEATLFVVRGDGATDSSEAASDPAPVVQPGGTISVPASPLSGFPPRLSLPASHGLFIPLSGRSEP